MTKPPDDVAEYAKLLVAGLNEAGVSLVAAVPDSHMKGAHRLLREQNKIRYVLAGNEADLPGICAGAYMGGMKALMIMENSGLRQACEPISRFAFTHHMPLVMIMSYCGDFGERNWWAINHAQTMEPLAAGATHPIPHHQRSQRDQAKHRARVHARGFEPMAGCPRLYGKLP